MDGTRKNIDPLLSLERIAENCGCRGRNSDWREWVFPGEGKGAEKPFRLAYRDLIRAKGEVPPEDPHPGLFFRRGVEGDVRTGGDAEESFFSSYGFLVDFFSQPDNAQELGGVLRQFMSRYCGADILSGVSKNARAEMERAEDGLVKSCGDGHAHVTDTLRLLYNGAMATLLGNGAGARIGAVHLGEGGRKLTPIGTPPRLAAALDREERGARGRVFCLDGRSGRCYERGGWTESEWIEAMSRIEAESAGSMDAKRAGMRALDPHYFPEKVTSAVAMRYNLLAELKDDALIHCRQGTTFSTVRLAVRLGGEGVSQGVSRGVTRGRQAVLPELGSGLDEGYSDADEGRYLPAPSSFEEMMPDDAGLEALETAEARGGSAAVVEAEKGKAKKGAKGGGAKEGGADKVARAVRKFLREGGRGSEEQESRLREIFNNGSVGPGDYDASQGCFVSASVGDPGGDPSAWRRKAGEARDEAEAVRLAAGILKKGAGRSAGVIMPFGDGVLLLGKTPKGIEARRVGGADFDQGARVARGKITYDGASYLAVGEVQRVPFGEAQRGGESARVGGAPLRRGASTEGVRGGAMTGILGALKRAFRGGR